MYNKNYTRKNMYKLVAIDLDGTLLNSYGEVSEKNKKWRKTEYAAVAQLDRVTGYEPVGRGFESL